MRALVLSPTGLNVQDVPTPPCGEGDVRVRLHAAALNHRDQYIREGKYARIVLPAILGSDGMGTITEAPSHPHRVGERVVIDPSLHWGANPRAQGPDFEVLGMPSQGTLAEEIVMHASLVHPAPEHLSDVEAAALPLGGVTAFRAMMRQGALQRGETVLITGIGGGVATFALLFAVAAGARVIVTSSQQHKIESALALGAHAGVVTSEDGWAKRVRAMGPVDLVVDSVGGDTMNDLADIVRPGGRIAIYGASRGAVPSMNLHRIFWKQITLIGSTMGTAQDFADMLSFVRTHSIRPAVDRVYTLDDAIDAFDRMRAAEQFGKIVVRCS